jgi:hypothetical protein
MGSDDTTNTSSITGRYRSLLEAQTTTSTEYSSEGNGRKKKQQRDGCKHCDTEVFYDLLTERESKCGLLYSNPTGIYL